MTTTINADTIVGGAVVTADASGVLALQAAGNTGLTLNSSRAIGVGASPSFGSSGQVLTSAGSAAAPTWVTPAGSALVLLSTITANNSATVSFENISSTYDTYMVVGNNIRSEYSTTTNLRVRPKLDGSFTPSASARYPYVGFGVTNGNSGSPTGISGNIEGATAFSQITDTSVVAGTENTFGTSFSMTLYGPMDSASLAKQATFQSVSRSATNSASFMNGSISFGTSNFNCGPMTGIQFYLASGNMVTGVFRIYGMTKA